MDLQQHLRLHTCYIKGYLELWLKENDDGFNQETKRMTKNPLKIKKKFCKDKENHLKNRNIRNNKNDHKKSILPNEF